MVDEPQDSMDDAMPAPPPATKSFLARNWPIPSLVIGAAALSLAMAYAFGPSRWRHRQAFLEDLDEVRRIVETRPYQARAVLAGLLRRSWRAPEHTAEIYYLLGRSNQILGDNPDIDSARAAPYREAALFAFEHALEYPVPEPLKLSLHESMGRMIVAVGDERHRSLATSMLSDALRRREELAWLLGRHVVHAQLQEEIDSSSVLTATEIWAGVEGVPLDQVQIAQEAHELAKQSRWQDLVEVVESVDNPFPDNPQAQTLHEQAASQSASGTMPSVRNLLADWQQANDGARSRILESLASAAALSEPPAHHDAAAWAKRRAELPFLTPQERGAARLDLAERWLAADEPRRAREVLLTILAASQADPRAAFLMAKSDLDEAQRIHKTTAAQWLRSHPALETIEKWRRRRWIDAESWPALLARPFQLVDRLSQPANVKKFYTDALYQRSVSEFRQLLQQRNIAEDLATQSRLWLGVALSALGRFHEAESELREVCRRCEASPLEQAALFYLSDLYRRDNNASQSLDVLRQAAETIAEPARFDNPYFGPEDLRDLFIDHWTFYQNKARDFDSALSIADLYRRFKNMTGVPPGQPDEFYADSNVALGRLGLEESRRSSDSEQAIARELAAWAHWREAGRAYRTVAQAREASDEYPGLLWESAVSLFEGHAYDEAIPMFETFLVAHVGGPRDFPARLYLTRSYMAKQDYARARKVLEESLRDQPSAVDRFRGRILLAQCYMEIARELPEDDKEARALLTGAEEILLANLNGQNQELEPSATEWRDSLFVLGQVYFETGRHDAAIPRFTEYIRRYPNEAGARDAENYVGESYLASAAMLERRIQRAASEREKARLLGDRAGRLEQALTWFHRLADRLLDAADAGRLPAREELLLGNALFKVGRINMMLARRQEALEIFEDLAYRYQDRPECLAAYVEMSSAYQALGRPADAHSSLRQALWILDRMEQDAFVRSDRNRDEMRKEIETLLSAP